MNAAVTDVTDYPPFPQTFSSNSLVKEFMQNTPKSVTSVTDSAD